MSGPRRVRSILGDAYCLFRYIITGSESQHVQVHKAVFNYLVRIEDFMEYIRGIDMDRGVMEYQG